MWLHRRVGLIQVLDPAGEKSQMGTTFWVRRFLLAFVVATFVITGSQLLRGRGLSYSLTQGLIWAAISASVFTVARIYQSRKGDHCAICRDTPEMQASDHRGKV
jgi:hypothetical protein